MRRERTLQKWVPLRILKIIVQNREKFLHSLKFGPENFLEFDSNKYIKICKLLYNLGYFSTLLNRTPNKLLFYIRLLRTLLQKTVFYCTVLYPYSRICTVLYNSVLHSTGFCTFNWEITVHRN